MGWAGGRASKQEGETNWLLAADWSWGFPSSLSLSLPFSFSLGLSLVVRLLPFFLCMIRVDSWTIVFTMSYLGIPLETTNLVAWCVFSVS